MDVDPRSAAHVRWTTVVTSPLARPAPGSILAGKYRVERVLGEGGMGIVLEATHLELDQRVAVKTLRPELAGMPDLIERFLREGRAAAKIEGEHVARVLDVVRIEGEAPLLVMEFLEGHDLSSVRAQRKPLAIDTAVGHVLEACEALAQAHALGIIHRDLKPANLFLARRRDGSERVKVLDFGISKMPGRAGASTSMTRTTAVMGSAEYMSPEHMVSTRDVDARTDIWALGVVLYELVTAEVPFPGESITQVCALVMSRPAPSPRLLRPDLPRSLELIILRCLEKDRGDRFASVDDLAKALEKVRAERKALTDVRADTVAAPSPGRTSDPAVSRAELRRPVRAPGARPSHGPALDIGDEETELETPRAVAEASLGSSHPRPMSRASSTTAATSSEPVPEPPIHGRTGLVIGALALAAVAVVVAIVGASTPSDAPERVANGTPAVGAPAPPKPQVEPVAPAASPPPRTASGAPASSALASGGPAAIAASPPTPRGASATKSAPPASARTDAPLSVGASSALAVAPPPAPPAPAPTPVASPPSGID